MPARQVRCEALVVQQGIIELGAPDLDVIGKLDAPLEAACGDAAVQKIAPLVVGLILRRRRRASIP
jgi:hypothetical protein